MTFLVEARSNFSAPAMKWPSPEAQRQSRRLWRYMKKSFQKPRTKPLTHEWLFKTLILQLCATTHIHVWKCADLCYRLDGLPGAAKRESAVSKGQGIKMRPCQMITFQQKSVPIIFLYSFLLKMLLKCNR